MEEHDKILRAANDPELLKRLVSMYVYSSCDCLVYIDAQSGRCVPCSGTAEAPEPFASCIGDYSLDLERCILPHTAAEDEAAAAEALPLPNILHMLETQGEYVFSLGLIDPKSGYARKRFEFRYYDKAEALLVLRVTDTTEAYLGTQNARAAAEESDRKLARHTEINQAFGRMYFAIYSVDLQSGQYLEIYTLDVFRKHIPLKGSNALLFDMVTEHYVSAPYQAAVRAFFDLGTVCGRLANQNAISCEFLGTTQGWCRASFIVESRAADGKVQRFVYVTQEINREKKEAIERIEKLNLAYEAANRANLAKSEFLSQMSHDIRTPLNAIMGFDTLIAKDPADTQKVRDYADKIMVSGKLLLSLLNEVLDMSKIENSETTLNPVPFRLSGLLAELEMVISTEAAAKGQSFKAEQTHLEHDYLFGDVARIRRVLFNILNNAVKYTGAGGSVRLCVSEQSLGKPDTALFVFTVRDNGIGIAPEYIDKIFEKFSRGDESNVSLIPGTGLGLSIAKSFTDLMGGTISVNSAAGSGSEFIISLPLQIAAAPQESAAPAKAAQKSAGKDILKGLHVLIAEDNAFNMEIVTELLACVGVSCDTAENGLQAVERFAASPLGCYGLIIMDVRMPVMDGCEAARQIRALPRGDAGRVPIIALTANAFAEDIEKAKLSGMNAHLAKPLDMDEFSRTVSMLLQGEN